MINGENMESIEIIKEAFVFPSKNIQLFVIYVILALLAGIFAFIGAILSAFGFISQECLLCGGILLIISMLIVWVLSGYLISVIKSGIDRDDEVPEFEWWDNFITGFDNFIVSIFYFIIPAFIVVFVALITNVFGNIATLATEILSQAENVYLGASTTIAYGTISQAVVNLAISLAITTMVAVIVFIIFLFLQTIAEARLANTGSLTEALNIMETAKDIKRIGVLDVILVILLIIIICAVIEMFLSAIFAFIPLLSILSIIVTPYLLFFAKRAVGLLYSNIA